jgi:hypothetical protein
MFPYVGSVHRHASACRRVCIRVGRRAHRSRWTGGVVARPADSGDGRARTARVHTRNDASRRSERSWRIARSARALRVRTARRVRRQRTADVTFRGRSVVRATRSDGECSGARLDVGSGMRSALLIEFRQTRRLESSRELVELVGRRGRKRASRLHGEPIVARTSPLHQGARVDGWRSADGLYAARGLCTGALRSSRGLHAPVGPRIGLNCCPSTVARSAGSAAPAVPGCGFIPRGAATTRARQRNPSQAPSPHTAERSTWLRRVDSGTRS